MGNARTCLHFDGQTEYSRLQLVSSLYFQLCSAIYIIAISERQWQTIADVSNQLCRGNAVFCFPNKVKLKTVTYVVGRRAPTLSDW